VLREVSGDAAIKLVQEAARGRVAAAGAAAAAVDNGA
jgi:hypothetical protein